MIKQIALISTLLISLGLSAQFQQDIEPSKSFSIREASQKIFYPNTTKAPSAEVVDTIWTDNFSFGSNWDYTGGTDSWNIESVLPASLISQGFDSSLNSAGGNFAFINSDAAGPNGSQDATLKWDGATIDCSAYPYVRLSFVTYLRQYQETRQILVSNDSGISWDTIPVLEEFSQNTTSPNGYLATVDISNAAGGQPDVLIAFRYVGSYDWFWCVDDVKIISSPNNDMALTQEFYNGVNDATYTNFYNAIPVKQADTASVKFGVEFKNTGGDAQTNVALVANVTFAGSPIFINALIVDTVNAGDGSSVEFDSLFYPNLGIGTYDISFHISADSADELPSDNIISKSFDVTSNQYRMDNEIQNTSNWYDVSNTWEMLVRYEIFAEDTAVSVSVYFPYNPGTGRGVAAGDSISFYVYSSTDLTNPVTKHENYEVDSLDENGWITLPMVAATLTPGLYYVGFKVYNKTSSVGSNSKLNKKTAPYTVLLRKDVTDPTDQWSYTTNFTPFVRMYTKNENECAGVNINIVDVINDSVSPGYIEITVTGGVPPYNYLWTWMEDTNLLTATTKNLAPIEHQGDYTVLVTDIFGCTGENTSIVGGIVSVKELNSNVKLKVFPNPSNGNFNLVAEGVNQGEFTLTIRDILGKTIHQETGNSNGVIFKNILLQSFKSGMYILELRTKTQVKTIQFILE